MQDVMTEIVNAEASSEAVPPASELVSTPAPIPDAASTVRNQSKIHPAHLVAALLLLIFFVTRIHNLLVLPVFLDEASHITRAQWAWDIHLDKQLYLLGTGKALGPYLMAFFWPFVGQVFIGRYVIMMLGMIGMASCYQVGRELHSREAGLLAMTLWILAPQLMFFERMALVDTNISAMAMLTIWIAIRMVRTGKMRIAVLCGVGLALCVLAKTTGIVFAPIPFLALFMIKNQLTPSRKIRLLAAAWLTAFILLLPIELYVQSTGEDPTGQKYGLTSFVPDRLAARIPRNISAVLLTERVYLSLPMVMLIIIAIAAALNTKRRITLMLLLCPLALLALIIVTVGKLWLRYSVPALPFFLLLTSIGLLEIVYLLRRFKFLSRIHPAIRLLPYVLIAVWALAFCIPFQLTAYANPAALDVPESDHHEYVEWISSGYGIKEAVDYLQTIITTPTMVVVTAANCDGARMYVPYGSPVNLYCPGVDWGGWGQTNLEIVQDIQRRALHDGYVYVLGENVPIIPEQYLPTPLTTLKEFYRPEPHGWYAIKVYRIEGRINTENIPYGK